MIDGIAKVGNGAGTPWGTQAIFLRSRIGVTSEGKESLRDKEDNKEYITFVKEATKRMGCMRAL